MKINAQQQCRLGHNLHFCCNSNSVRRGHTIDRINKARVEKDYTERLTMQTEMQSSFLLPPIPATESQEQIGCQSLFNL
jgi:hypothetical protein